MRHTKNRTRPLDEALRSIASLCLSWIACYSCLRQALICICFASIRQHAIDLVLFLQLSFLCSPPCCSSLLFLCVLLIVCVIVLRLLVSLSVLALLRCSSYCRFFLVSLPLVYRSELFFSGSCDCSWWFVGNFEVYGRRGKKICYVLSYMVCSSCRRWFVGSASRRLQYHCGVQSCNAARPQHQASHICHNQSKIPCTY